jgi:transcriptional regulator with XRE-family HTH domain
MAKSGPRLRGSGKRQHVLLSLLRSVREEAGISQKELAAALGVDQTIVSKYEHGVRRLDLLELDAICGFVGIRLEEFIRRYRAETGTAVGRKAVAEAKRPRSPYTRPETQ